LDQYERTNQKKKSKKRKERKEPEKVFQLKIFPLSKELFKSPHSEFLENFVFPQSQNRTSE